MKALEQVNMDGNGGENPGSEPDSVGVERTHPRISTEGDLHSVFSCQSKSRLMPLDNFGQFIEVIFG